MTKAAGVDGGLGPELTEHHRYGPREATFRAIHTPSPRLFQHLLGHRYHLGYELALDLIVSHRTPTFPDLLCAKAVEESIEAA